MKKIMFILCLGAAVFCFKPVNAQTADTYRSQRDSIHALFIFVLDKYDSVTVANAELNKKMDRMGLELAGLKTEIDNILKKKSESQAELTKAKKLIAEQAALVEKLEAEVKRLSQSKKTTGNQQ